jgi:folate-binding protein YgfZ
VTGKDGLDLLNRLSTNKLDELSPRNGEASILTNSKGRVIDLLYVSRVNDDLLILTSPQTPNKIMEWIEFYTFLEEVNVENITEKFAMFSILGPQAREFVGELVGSLGIEMSRYENRLASIGGQEVTIFRSDPIDSPGFDFIVERKGAISLWKTFMSKGAVPVGEQCFDLARIGRGIPRYGAEIGDSVNPWEANLQEHINFEKGCYIGQEVILRLNTYGKVKRRLMYLEFSENDNVLVGDRLTENGKDIGEVTSVVREPGSGITFGLGFVKKNSLLNSVKLNSGKDSVSLSELSS